MWVHGNDENNNIIEINYWINRFIFSKIYLKNKHKYNLKFVWNVWNEVKCILWVFKEQIIGK